MGFTLKQVVPWGRSYEEYCAMFNLQVDELGQSILGAGDGPAAFNAAHSRQQGQSVSVDPLYQFSAQQIAQRIDEIYADMLEQVAKNAAHLNLQRFGSAQQLGQQRMRAMQVFLQDYDEGRQQGRYINAALPVLPFTNQQFDLALCSHLLFLYSQQLDISFHVNAVNELCRVAKTVRIFPLVDLQHQRSQHLDEVIASIQAQHHQVSIVDVEYEFQIGAHQMLQIQVNQEVSDENM